MKQATQTVKAKTPPAIEKPCLWGVHVPPARLGQGNGTGSLSLSWYQLVLNNGLTLFTNKQDAIDKAQSLSSTYPRITHVKLSWSEVSIYRVSIKVGFKDGTSSVLGLGTFSTIQPSRYVHETGCNPVNPTQAPNLADIQAELDRLIESYKKRLIAFCLRLPLEYIGVDGATLDPTDAAVHKELLIKVFNKPRLLKFLKQEGDVESIDGLIQSLERTPFRMVVGFTNIAKAGSKPTIYRLELDQDPRLVIHEPTGSFQEIALVDLLPPFKPKFTVDKNRSLEAQLFEHLATWMAKGYKAALKLLSQQFDMKGPFSNIEIDLQAGAIQSLWVEDAMKATPNHDDK